MKRADVIQSDGMAASAQAAPQPGAQLRAASEGTFHDAFVELFNAHFDSIFRFLDRLAGDPELAADLAQDTFVKLYRRRALPDSPAAWLITVALNLFRNARSSRTRRRALLTAARSEGVHSEPLQSPAHGPEREDTRRRVRAAIDALPERERTMLLLRAEGYRYHDIAAALKLNEASVGTLLARARAAFRRAYEQAP